MKMQFEPIAHSWVAKQTDPIGVVEFLGGALYGVLPQLSYRYFLKTLWQAGYTIIAVPFRFGLNHQAIANLLLEERNQIRAELSYPSTLPHFWVGHSLGCKYIALLEAYGKILDQPSLLIAPDISDTKDALPLPAIAQLLDDLRIGVCPNRQETQRLIGASHLFTLTAVISFKQDAIAGNRSQPVEQSDVAWLIAELQRKQDGFLIAEELPGGHREPIGVLCGEFVVRPGFDRGIQAIQSRSLEPLAIQFLEKLHHRL